MTTKELAQQRLILSNDNSLHRDRDQTVKIIADGLVVASVPRSDWEDVAAFFVEIIHPEALL
jgi:hypothetical protein